MRASFPHLILFISLKAAKTIIMIISAINSFFFFFFPYKFEVFSKPMTTVMPDLVEKCIFNNKNCVMQEKNDE